MNLKKNLPLRLGVGVIVLNDEDKVFVGKRKDNPMAKLLSLPNFQQKKIKSKKLYDRNQAKFTLLNWEDGGH